MKELEVGMYVRTIKGIGRIEEITEDKTEIYFNCDTGLSISFIKKDFTQEEMAEFYKHSHNIIDLIEVGDYVNGERVNDVNLGNRNYVFCGLHRIYANEIKSIITKEQFETMKYVIKENR